MLAAGALLGLLLWHVAGSVGGDGFFHLARVQKLLAFDDLSLDSTNEFPDGGPHPGYAFPLWHGVVALVAKVSGADPVDAVRHLPTVLAPLAVVLAFEAGWALFRRVVPAATAAAAGVAIVAMAPGAGGALTALALPATASRQLLVPAALALAHRDDPAPDAAARRVDRPRRRSSLAVRPSDVRALPLDPVRRLPRRPLALGAPRRAGRRPRARRTRRPGGALLRLAAAGDRRHGVGQPRRARGGARRSSTTPVSSTGRPTGSPSRRSSSAGPARSRWRRCCCCRSPGWPRAVGGRRTSSAGRSRCSRSASCPWLFTPFSDVVSLSQSRRLAGFLPLAFALAGGLGVLARVIGPAVAPVALVAGRRVPVAAIRATSATRSSTAAPRGRRGSPSRARSRRSGSGAGRGRRSSRRPRLRRRLLLLPTYVHGLTDWSPSEDRRPNRLSDGLIEAVRDRVPAGATSSTPTRSRAIGSAPSRRFASASTRPGHVADTVDNRPAGARPRVPPVRADRRPRDPARVRRDVARRRPRPVRPPAEARPRVSGRALAPLSALSENRCAQYHPPARCTFSRRSPRGAQQPSRSARSRSRSRSSCRTAARTRPRTSRSSARSRRALPRSTRTRRSTRRTSTATTTRRRRPDSRSRPCPGTAPRGRSASRMARSRRRPGTGIGSGR